MKKANQQFTLRSWRALRGRGTAQLPTSSLGLPSNLGHAGTCRAVALVVATLVALPGLAAGAATTGEKQEVVVENAWTGRVGSMDASHRRYSRRGHFGFFLAPFAWSAYYGWPYGGSVWVEGPYGGQVGPWGAVDLNIKPKSAEVFVDGEYVGRVDQLDGFPRYLWLESGTHHIVVYKPGYESIARKVELRSGEVLDLRTEMIAGDAKTPEELFEQLEPEVQPEAVAERPRPRTPPRADRPATEEWRQPSPRSVPGSVAADQRAEPGRIVVTVEPTDAVVYLDGRLLGSGVELQRLHHGLIVEPGPHTLEAVRPGYGSVQRQIEARSGEELVLDLTLRLAPGGD
jgi:hypothetical protein